MLLRVGWRLRDKAARGDVTRSYAWQRRVYKAVFSACRVKHLAHRISRQIITCGIIGCYDDENVYLSEFFRHRNRMSGRSCPLQDVRIFDG